MELNRRSWFASLFAFVSGFISGGLPCRSVRVRVTDSVDVHDSDYIPGSVAVMFNGVDITESHNVWKAEEYSDGTVRAYCFRILPSWHSQNVQSSISTGWHREDYVKSGPGILIRFSPEIASRRCAAYVRSRGRAKGGLVPAGVIILSSR